MLAAAADSTGKSGAETAVEPDPAGAGVTVPLQRAAAACGTFLRVRNAAREPTGTDTGSPDSGAHAGHPAHGPSRSGSELEATNAFFQCATASAAAMAQEGYLQTEDVALVETWFQDLLHLGYTLASSL